MKTAERFTLNRAVTLLGIQLEEFVQCQSDEDNLLDKERLGIFRGMTRTYLHYCHLALYINEDSKDRRNGKVHDQRSTTLHETLLQLQVIGESIQQQSRQSALALQGPLSRRVITQKEKVKQQLEQTATASSTHPVDLNRLLQRMERGLPPERSEQLMNLAREALQRHDNNTESHEQWAERLSHELAQFND
jgi:hypothetical protein